LANRLPLWQQRAVRARFINPVIYMAFSLVLGTIIPYPIISYIVFGIISLCWLIFYKQINNLMLKKNKKKKKKAGKLPMQNNIHMLFDENDFTEKTELNESKYLYSCIESINMGEKAIYLYNGAVQAFIIPNSVFNDVSEKELFKQFVKSKTDISQ
jgi:hypothetical protein